MLANTYNQQSWLAYGPFTQKNTLSAPKVSAIECHICAPTGSQAPTETLKNSSSHQLPTAARGTELTLLLLLSGGSLLAPPRTYSTALMEVEEGDPLVFSHWRIANCSHICIHYEMSHCTVKSAFKWDLKTDGIKTSLTFIKSAQQTGVALFLLLLLFVFPTTDQSNTMWCWRRHNFATWLSSPDFWQPAALTARPFQRPSLLSVPEPRRHSQAHRWSDFRYTGRGSDRFSFTVWRHNVFPDIWRHLSQQGRTVQSNLAPRIPMTRWLIQGPLQVFYFWDTNGAKQWYCQMMSTKDESGIG